MSFREPPPKFTGDLKSWSSKLVDYLIRSQQSEEGGSLQTVNLRHRLGAVDKAVQDGTIMYDPVVKSVVLAKDGEWVPLVLEENLTKNDAFGRLRVSDPLTLFDSQLQYNANDLLYETVATGTGSIAHNPEESSVTLTVAAGDTVLRQSRQYIRYKPGKSQYVLLTGVLGATPAEGLIRRIGYFDDDNGLYLKQDSAGLSFVRRTKTSGVVVEETVPQPNWSEDQFLTLDPANTILLFIDMEWLGVGQVRIGFFEGGVPKTAHIFNDVPNAPVPYMATANLPVRYQLTSTGAASGSMKQICTAVISEGGFEEETGIPQARGSFAGRAISAAELPIIGVRPKALFNGLVNRGTIIPEAVEIFSTADAVYKVYYNAALTTGASWASQGANSIAEYDVSATGVDTANAELIASGFVAAGSSVKAGTAKAALTSRLPIVLDKAGANPIGLVVTMNTLGGNGTGYAVIQWRELY